MSEYPDYFPPFLNEFHRQKDFFKAFYLWRLMMDNKLELEQGKDRFGSRLSDMSNFMELQCLFASVLDFLRMHGWQLYRTRKKGDVADIDKTVADLKKLELAWWSLGDPIGILKMKPESIKKAMSEFSSWIMYMPEEIKTAYAAFLQENPAEPEQVANE